jgi:hypothetical protein
VTQAAAKRTSSIVTASTSRWEALFGCPAPQRLPSLVERAIAWREQVLLQGDVPGAIAHDLQLAAEQALTRRGPGREADPSSPDEVTSAMPATQVNEGVGVPLPARAIVNDGMSLCAAGEGVATPAGTARKGVSARAGSLPPAASQLLTGSRLIKAHGGRNHVVTVEEHGFRYDGELFSSLSAIAKHITGTHWNGLLFFGLRKRRSYPPKPRRHG